MSQAHTL